MLRHKLAVAAQFFDMTGECVYCAMRNEELAAKVRLVDQHEHFVTFAPYASQTPFETWILPREQQASFGLLQSHKLEPLARILKFVLLRLHVALSDPDFNLLIDLLIDTAPRGEEDGEFFLWHIQIMPRLTERAGFEMGSGMAINPVFPETAAEILWAVQIDDALTC